MSILHAARVAVFKLWRRLDAGRPAYDHRGFSPSPFPTARLLGGAGAEWCSYCTDSPRVLLEASWRAKQPEARE